MRIVESQVVQLQRLPSATEAYPYSVDNSTSNAQKLFIGAQI